MAKKEKVDKKKKGKRGLAAFLFSRTFIFVLMVIVQLLLFIYLAYYAYEIKYLNLIITILKIIFCIYIVNDRSDPTMKLVWVLFITILPAFGVLFFLYVRIQPSSHSLKKKLSNLNFKCEGYLHPDKRLRESILIKDTQLALLSDYIYDNTGCLIHSGSDVEYFSCGEEYYSRVMELIEKAEKFIFLEFFIIEEGSVWNSILNVLERKAAEGVEVRVMYDGLCSLTKLEIGYYKKLRKKGIKSKPFTPARPFLTTKQNNRDHRKNFIIDGKYAFTGGVNLADEYMNLINKFGYWKDSAVCVKGDAVKSFTYMFLKMWNVSEISLESFNNYLDVDPGSYLNINSGYIMPYCDDPFGDERVGKSVYLHIINNASRYLYIMSPYLVLDNVMISALRYAGRKGVDVRLILPGIPDKAYAYCLARTYYRELIENGIKLYEFTPGFVHAKMFLADDEIATVGSVNLDYRSLQLHFENGCLIYRNHVINDIMDDFNKTFLKCRQVNLTMCDNRPVYYKLAGQILKIIAPLM